MQLKKIDYGPEGQLFQADAKYGREAAVALFLDLYMRAYTSTSMELEISIGAPADKDGNPVDGKLDIIIQIEDNAYVFTPNQAVYVLDMLKQGVEEHGDEHWTVTYPMVIETLEASLQELEVRSASRH